jgi:uncharacterized Zn finger protein (UPF0148 family)
MKSIKTGEEICPGCGSPAIVVIAEMTKPSNAVKKRYLCGTYERASGGLEQSMACEWFAGERNRITIEVKKEFEGRYRPSHHFS